MQGCTHKHMCVYPYTHTHVRMRTNTPEESCWWALEVNGSSSSSSGSDNISEEACVAEEVDGSSSWGSEIISEEACVAEEVDGSSSWPVPEGAPKYFRSAPEFALKYSIWVWHPNYIYSTIKIYMSSCTIYQTFRIGTKLTPQPPWLILGIRHPKRLNISQNIQNISIIYTSFKLAYSIGNSLYWVQDLVNTITQNLYVTSMKVNQINNVLVRL